MQICKFILGQVACMKRGPHNDSVMHKDLEQIFISDQGTRCLFLEKKGGGRLEWGGVCYLVRALLFTERARARLVCDTVLLLQECCVCWLTMSILAFDRAGIKVHTLHQGDSIVTVLIHPPSLSLSPIAGVRDDRIIARYLKSFKFSHVSEMTFFTRRNSYFSVLFFTMKYF